VLVVCDKLDETPGTLLERLPRWGDDFEIDGGGCAGRDGIDLPSGGLSDTNLGLTNTRRFLSGRDGVSDKT